MVASDIWVHAHTSASKGAFDATVRHYATFAEQKATIPRCRTNRDGSYGAFEFQE